MDEKEQIKMKVSVETKFVVNMDLGDLSDYPQILSPVVLRPLVLASIANMFESQHQRMLIQHPHIESAEVVSIEEIKE